MKVPLTSLDPVDWLVWSDWCADHDRVKAERFGRKCAASLLKFLSVGTDPRQTLYAGSMVRTKHPAYQYVPAVEFVKGPYGQYRWSLHRGWVYPDVYLQDCYWVRPPQQGARVEWPCPQELLNTVADLPVEWRDSRLAWKWWKVLNRRALGIKEIGHGPGAGV